MNSELHPRFSQGAAPAAGAPSGAIDPAYANGNLEWLDTMGKAGFSIGYVRAPYTPALWANSDFEKRLGSELTEAGLGHLDSVEWGNPIIFFFYLHSKSLAAGLQLIKSRLAAIGLLSHVEIGYADPVDECWRTLYPGLEKAGT